MRPIRVWFGLAVLAATIPQPAYGGIFDHLPSWPLAKVGDSIPSELIELWSGGGPKGHDGQPLIAKWCPGLKGHFDSFPFERSTASA
jgi:hypothetical protein